MLESQNVVRMELTRNDNIAVYLPRGKKELCAPLCGGDFNNYFPDLGEALQRNKVALVWVCVYDRKVAGAIQVECAIQVKRDSQNKRVFMFTRGRYLKQFPHATFHKLFGDGLVPGDATEDNPVKLWLRLELE